jgi:DNA-binding XRE family transcriptional regulator
VQTGDYSIVREIREWMRFTQTELAKEMGVRREVITRIETGKRRISNRLARKLSNLSTIDFRDIRLNDCPTKWRVVNGVRRKLTLIPYPPRPPKL